MNRKFMNSKGIFITLTAFFLIGLLFSSTQNLERTKLIEEDAITLSIASQRTSMVRQNLYDGVRTIYNNAQINWDINDTNLIYSEILPSFDKKQRIAENLSKFKSFFYHEHPLNTTIGIDSIDSVQLIVYGKDLNILHSDTNGFGENKNIYFNYSEKKFNTIQFDINSSNPINLYLENYSPCLGCSNPMNIIVNVRNDQNSIIYSLNNTVNMDISGNIDFNSSVGLADISLGYTNSRFFISTTNTPISVLSKITFNDPLFYVNIDQTGTIITETYEFGFVG